MPTKSTGAKKAKVNPLLEDPKDLEAVDESVEEDEDIDVGIEEDEDGQIAGTEKPVAKQNTATQPASVTPPNSDRNADAQLAKGAADMKAILAKQRTVRVLIPLAPAESKNATELVCIQGYCQYVKKGIFVEVPEQVAEIIAQHLEIDLNLGSEFRLDGNSQKQDALA
jgi:hypothetical protein